MGNDVEHDMQFFQNLTLNIVSVNASDVAQSLQMVAWYLSYNT